MRPYQCSVSVRCQLKDQKKSGHQMIGRGANALILFSSSEKVCWIFK